MYLAGAPRPGRTGRRHSSPPGRIDRLDHQRNCRARCRRRLRPSSTATAALRSASSLPRLPRRELAAQVARSSGEPQSDFEAALHDFEAALGLPGDVPSPSSGQVGTASQRGPRSRELLVHPWGPGPHGTYSGPGLESLSVPDLLRLVSTTHRPTGHVTRNRTGSSPTDLPRPRMTNLGMYDLFGDSRTENGHDVRVSL